VARYVQAVGKRQRVTTAGEIDGRGAWLWPLLLGVYAVGSGVAVWVLPPVLVGASLAGAAADGEALTLAERAAAITAARQVVLLAAGGLLAVITLMLTQRRDAVARARHEIDRDANRTTRYTEAVKQLGDDKAAVRFGGIYALGRIAEDSERDRGTIIQVLVAYVREAAPHPSPIVTRSRMEAHNARTSATVQLSTAKAAVEVIAVLSALQFQGSPVDLSGTSLQRADLGRAGFAMGDFSGSYMRDVVLWKASLTGCGFNRADLTNAHLENVDAGGGDFQDVLAQAASFVNAVLDGADFRKAMLESANFVEASMKAALLAGADASGAVFDGAVLVGANFRGADLLNASFRGADLRDADLRGVRAEGSIDFRNADLRGITYDGDLALLGDTTGAHFRNE
jgi:uncharacterized protein YjbI with pentapeptide repeats